MIALLAIYILRKKDNRAAAARQPALSTTALLAHIKSCGRLPRGYSRVKTTKNALRTLRECETLCASIEPNATLTPTSKWLCDNARILEETTLTITDAAAGLILPKALGEARVQTIAREIVANVDGKVDAELIAETAKAYSEAYPLTEAELWALPIVIQIELINLIIGIAKTCVNVERTRAEARSRLSDTSRISKSIHGANGAYLEQIISGLLEREDSAGLQSVDAYLASLDQTAERVVANEHHRETRECYLIGNAITSLRRLGIIDWNKHEEALSHIHAIYSADHVYNDMDFHSRCLYRDETARIARRLHRPEGLVAKCVMSLCSRHIGDEIAGHVGYYLIDDGRGELKQSLRIGRGIGDNARPYRENTNEDTRRNAAGIYMASVVLLDALLACGLYLLNVPIFALALSLPLLSEVSRFIANNAALRLTRPRLLPRMAGSSIKTKTLVVVPSLLLSKEHALSMVRHMSVLRYANPQDTIEYMLLADFGDSDTETRDGDDIITRAALAATNALNDVWGGGFMYAHRKRVHCPQMGKYMGEDRKRGALEELNEWLATGELTRELAASTVDVSTLAGKYACVVTLDADTQLPPDTALMLSGALLHPLNRSREYLGRRRGYAILQPRMEISQGTVRSRLAKLYGGEGGFDPYVTAANDLYQNIAGAGSFGGKGAYDPAAFREAVRGKIRKGTILSHDLLEGCLSGSAMVCDTVLFDGQPQTLAAWYKRQHRWTRGDWQLLPWLMPRVSTEHGTVKNPLSLLSKYKIYDNLRRSVLPIFQLILIPLAVYIRNPALVVAALIAPCVGAFIPPRLTPIKTFLARLALLPSEAFLQVDAIARTVWRVCVSKKNLLEWVTSAQTEGKAEGAKRRGVSQIPGIVSAAALASSAALMWMTDGQSTQTLTRFTPVLFCSIAACVVSLAWLCSRVVGNHLDGDAYKKQQLNEKETTELRHMAEATWRFFERNVNELTHNLPPDNIQLEPRKGVAMRTSPTNIGMYLLSCSAALSLGFISRDEFMRRVAACAATISRLETWRGHLFNWYDLRTLEPLAPRYVSSVDSGNFAVCLTAAAQAVRQALCGDSQTEYALQYTSLPCELQSLAERIEFGELFDSESSLFYVGVNTESGETGSAKYDLLASESRLLSFYAVMFRLVPLKHWRALGRSVCGVNGGVRDNITLVSWVGTMFEYLMPSLLQATTPNTLLGVSLEGVVKAQVLSANGSVWGISESGYYAFDGELNYQYKAFGLPEISLRGGLKSNVVSPYSSALALETRPKEAVSNLIRLRGMGMMGDMGFYEACDFDTSRIPPTRSYSIISSHMAHHQGMILCGIANALTNGAIRKLYSNLPETEAYRLLLEERPPRKARFARPQTRTGTQRPSTERTANRRIVNKAAWPVAVKLIHGGGTTVMCDAHGNGYLAHNGIMLTRFRPDPTIGGIGPTLFMKAFDGKSIPFTIPLNRECGEMVFDTGRVETTYASDGLEVCSITSVSPLDGVMAQYVTLRNRSGAARTVELASFVEVALASQTAYIAHPTFQNLFVETDRPAPNMVTAKRRPRKEGERYPLFAHWAACDGEHKIMAQTDRAAFMARDGSLPGIEKPFSERGETIGAVVDPCLSLQVEVNIADGDDTHVLFCYGVVNETANVKSLAERYQTAEDANRLISLAITQEEVTAKHLALTSEKQLAAETLASYLVYRGQPAGRREYVKRNGKCATGVWELGISGDLPIVSLLITDAAGLQTATTMLRVHEYLRRLGLWFDLVFIAENEEGYLRPIRDALRETISGSSARDLFQKPSGIFLFCRDDLVNRQKDNLLAMSAITLRGGVTIESQLAELRRTPRETQAKPDMQPAQRPTQAKVKHRVRSNGVQAGGIQAGGVRSGGVQRRIKRAYPAAVAPKPLLQRDNGFGGFDADGSYVVYDTPPAPYSNILASPLFGSIVTDRGIQTTWYKNSGLSRLTPFPNDPLRDVPSEVIYIRDEETGDYVSATPSPCGVKGTVRHAQGYTTYTSNALGLTLRLTVFTDVTKPCGIRTLHIKNNMGVKRELSVTSYVRWEYRNAAETSLLSVTYQNGAVEARHDNITLVSGMRGVDVSSHTLDGLGFVGRGDISKPEAMEGDLSGAIGEQPIGAMRGAFALPPLGEREIIVTIGALEE